MSEIILHYYLILFTLTIHYITLYNLYIEHIIFEYMHYDLILHNVKLQQIYFRIRIGMYNAIY